MLLPMRLTRVVSGPWGLGKAGQVVTVDEELARRLVADGLADRDQPQPPGDQPQPPGASQ